MRKKSLAIVLVTLLAWAQGSQPTLAVPPIELRLSCDRSGLATEEPLFCLVLLLNPREGVPTLISETLVPFELSHRPPMVIEFQAIRNGVISKLPLAPRADKGNYDLATLSSSELRTLLPGRAYGWEYDVNGADWLMPRQPGDYELLARVRVELLKPGKGGGIDRVVKELLGKRPSFARSWVLNDELVSNRVKLTVTRQPCSGKSNLSRLREYIQPP